MSTDLEELIKYVKALVALQLKALSTDEEPERTEVYLSRAGLSYPEIGEMLGVTPDSVRMAVNRVRKTAKSNSAKKATRRAAR